ncbi:nitrate- and nitrite sensing domain-containing protein [Herbidospora cretacea]|uniref:nitrate- and nitrite sensing domain-containing protein n=1 Tax=Herbidospora cretacea TaxID=28444 RepID=UPI001FDEBEE7|nr:nitrate- and nitrite sensing domain-containing protein [Herbidospora cretacea]
MRVISAVTSAAEYQRVSDIAAFTGTLGELVHELELEQSLTSRYASGNRTNESELNLIDAQQAKVDLAAEKVQDRVPEIADSLGDLGKEKLTRVDGRLSELPNLREVTVKSDLLALPTIEKYSLVIGDLLRFYEEVAQGGTDEAIDGTSTAMTALARAKHEQSTMRSLLDVGIKKRSFTPNELDALTAARKRFESEISAFRLAATPAERQLYADTVTGSQIDQAEFLRGSAMERIRLDRQIVNLDGTPGDDSKVWFEASSFGINRMYEVEKALDKSIIDQADALAASDQRGALVNILIVVVILALVLLITTGMARSLTTPLRRLRSEALEIAGHRLPDLVQRLRETDASAQDSPPHVAPIGVSGADEIGEVARAFDEVHREAVRLAGDESRLRSNISAMFVNLSRRTQTLVERQIALIDGLEQGEQDEARLGNLFKLDHLATRMRRNSENLLVLAGQEPARRWSQPVEVTDVVRASLSEVEGYERVVINVPGEVSLAGQAVNDVIHLLAELVENAISFSARDTRVIVSGNRIDGGGVMVSVTDSGIGMNPDEIGATNWRLANPPVVDVSVSRRMGLFVVGRLALRNGIRVQIRNHDGGGLTAMVLLPESLIASAPNAVQQSQHYNTGGYAPTWSPKAQMTQGPADTTGGWGAPQLGAPGARPALPSPGPLGPSTGPYQSPSPAPVQHTGPHYAAPQHTGPQHTGPQQHIGQQHTGPQHTGPQHMGQQHTGPQNSLFGPPPRQQAPLQGPNGAPGGQPPTMFGPPPPMQQQPGGPLPRRRFDSALGGLSGLSERDADVTGPLPAVREPAGQDRPEEFLPIFASVESAWFKKPEDDTKVEEVWKESKADSAWGVAAQQPQFEASTSAGLPKRVPKANLVPGSAEPNRQAAVSPPPSLSPDRARSRLSSLQHGVRQGRAVARGEISEDEGYSGRGE